ncbi:MarR family winged helix-turn-helix transcriptional regulator [Actinophytocola sp. KF-1]
MTTDDRELATALVGLSHHVLHLFADVGRSHGLSQQQTELICAVVVPGRIRMADLGRQLHMEKSALSNLVDRAEQRGLLTRARDENDRRVTWVTLTEAGHELAVRTHCEVTARTSELVSKLSLTDQRHLTDVVRRLLEEAD